MCMCVFLCRVYKSRSGKWTLNSYQPQQSLQEEENIEKIVLTNATYDQLNRNPEEGRRSKRGRDRVDVNKKEDPVTVEVVEEKKTLTDDRIRVGSMLEVKVNLAAADDEQKMTSF